jgi:hypothetical protein
MAIAHSRSALQVANELAMRCGRRLELLHITSAVGEPARRDRRERLLSSVRSDLGRGDLPLLMGTGAPAHELTCASRRAARRGSSSSSRWSASVATARVNCCGSSTPRSSARSTRVRWQPR